MSKPDKPAKHRDLTIIIPVFNAFDALSACLASLDRHSAAAPIIVIDDASNDPRIRPLLAEWVAQRTRTGRATRLIHHEQNQGFVRTANEAAGLVDGDFVLLNSDTQVTAGWLDALQRCLASDPLIASATPWSNNAEIVSLPEFCVANPVPEDPDQWAQAVRAAAQGNYPDLPTAVGFCMAVPARAFDALGLFDAQTFGRGYGEENDFCRRAAKAGWRNVLCEDAFVVHRGGESFAPLGLVPGDETMQRLLKKHSDYLATVSRWISEDPLAPRRAAAINAFRSAGLQGAGRNTVIGAEGDRQP